MYLINIIEIKDRGRKKRRRKGERGRGGKKSLGKVVLIEYHCGLSLFIPI